MTACNNESVPELPVTGEQGTFEFLVDPQSETVTLIENERFPSNLQQQYLPSDTRILVPDVDLGLKDYTYAFLANNKLIIQTKFENLNENAYFLQPFFFTLNTNTENIESATAPLVTDSDLGGDSALEPGESSSRLSFEIIHKGKPFTFFVDVSAAVISRTRLPVEGATAVTISDSIIVVGVALDNSAYVFERQGGPWEEVAKLTPSDGAEGDSFGASAANNFLDEVSDRILIGAPGDDDIGLDSGSAYVFVNEGGVWQKSEKLHPLEGSTGSGFGTSVALFDLVGAPFDDQEAGSFYVDDKDGWKPRSPSDSEAHRLFGFSLASFSTSAVIGAPGTGADGQHAGSAYGFHYSEGQWYEVYKLTAPDGIAGDRFGHDVSIAGRTIAVGAFKELTSDGRNIARKGNAYIFDLTFRVEEQEPIKLVVPNSTGEQLGYSVAVWGDGARGDRVLVGAVREEEPYATKGYERRGGVYLFERNGESWKALVKLTSDNPGSFDGFGSDIAVGDTTAVVAADEAVYVFEFP